MPDIVGKDWDVNAASVSSAWETLSKWVQAGSAKWNTTTVVSNPGHRVVDAVRELEALGKLPVGTGDQAEALWQLMLSTFHGGIDAVAAAQFVADVQALVARKV